jgi:hypothetical protein
MTRALLALLVVAGVGCERGEPEFPMDPLVNGGFPCHVVCGSRDGDYHEEWCGREDGSCWTADGLRARHSQRWEMITVPDPAPTSEEGR